MTLYHYRESGLSNIWLDGVLVEDTPYGPATSIPALDNLHKAIGMSIAKANRDMTGEEFRFLRIELDLSQRALADLLRVDEQTVRRWEQGKSAISGPAQLALRGYYIETESEDGTLRDLMRQFSHTDRQICAARLEFHRDGDDWTPDAA